MTDKERAVDEIRRGRGGRVTDRGSTLITLTDQDMRDTYERIMGGVPYGTPGQLRDAVFFEGKGPLCCANCYDYTHPHAEAWRAVQGWLYLSEQDWRTVE